MTSILKHSIRLHFPYTFNASASPSSYKAFTNRLTKLNIKNLIDSADFLQNDVHESFHDSVVWEKDLCKLDSRIHAFGAKLINGIQDISFSEGFFGMQPLKLSKDALRVINQGSPNDLGKGLAVSLKAAAIKRLAEKNITPPLTDDAWPLMFNSIWFYGLNTGVGMLVVDLSISQPGKKGLSIKNVEELQEFNYIISRNAKNKQSAKISWGVANVTLGLSDLVETLLPEKINKHIELNPTDDRSSVYAYTFIATNIVLDYDQRKTYIFKIARKYNELYLQDKTDEQIDYFEPFQPVTHAFSLEGSVTYIDLNAYGENIPESILNFDKSAIPVAYAPLVLLTYAEYVFLREMATNSNDEDRVDMRNPTNENLEKLREFRTSLYDFRLNFRYTQISANTNHNLFCNTNKKALEIEKLLAETSSDVQEIEQYISDFVSQKQDKRLKKFGILGTLFAAIISWVELWGITLNQIIFDTAQVEPASIITFLVVLVLLGGAVLYTSNSSSND